MAELAPGAVFAGHRIEAVAGRGGMGVVYRARQLELERTVALKVIAPGLLDDQTMRERFVRESKVAASIDHPNVIPIYYVGAEDGIAYIAMRYVPGEDLRHVARHEGRLVPARAAEIVAQVGAALDAAHEAGLVHRDVKPANILLARDDHVYLTDFGLTKRMVSVEGSTRPGHWVGTLDYVAPEQIRGERVDARADVYSLGCVLFFTLTGQVPFRREDDEAKLWAHLSEPPPPASTVVPGIPPALDDVVARALAKQPGDRYPSAGDLGRAALAAAAGLRPGERERVVAQGAAAPVDPEAETVERSRTVVRRRSSRRPALAVLALAVAVAAGVAGALALGGPETATTPTPTATPASSPTPTPTPGLRVAADLEVGERPNIVRANGDNVYVASGRLRNLSIVSARTGRLRSYSPEIGPTATDAAVGLGSIWFTLYRPQSLVRVDARTGRPRGKPVVFAARPQRIAIADGAVFVSLVRGEELPDQLVKLDPRTGQTLASVDYPFGVSALTASPSALWVANRRRARVDRVDLDTLQVLRSPRIGSSRAEDAVYHDGAVWLAMPKDNAVYKLITATADIVPVAVERRPRQLAIARGKVYVTNHDSSVLSVIDEEEALVVGEPFPLPANPYAVAVDRRGAIWVTSLAAHRLTKLVTGPGG